MRTLAHAWAASATASWSGYQSWCSSCSSCTGEQASRPACSTHRQSQPCTHTSARARAKRAAYLQSSVVAQLAALCVAARLQRLRHISQNAGDTVDNAPCPSQTNRPTAALPRIHTPLQLPILLQCIAPPRLLHDNSSTNPSAAQTHAQRALAPAAHDTAAASSAT